jgi:pimeloyl-ACP methyl ester carboxylesterase
MNALRTRFKNDIVCEFMAPRRDTGRVIIFCSGMPGYPSKKSLLDFYSKKGYWVFMPRYRGSWESDGKFLKRSPHLDILDVIEGLSKSFLSLWDNKHYSVKCKKLYIFGSSFGGPAALLASRDPRVTKVILVSPVVDWRARSKMEPLDWLRSFVHKAFGQGYRFSDKDWKKLLNGRFYNPVHVQYDIDGSKILVFHAKDDGVVGWRTVQKFAKATGSRVFLYKRGGHLGSLFLTKPAVDKKVQKFIRT